MENSNLKYIDDSIIYNFNLLQPIQVFDNFITADECDELLKLKEGKYTKSKVYSENKEYIDNTSRTSSNSYFFKSENDLIKKIENKVVNMLNIKLEQIEPLQIVKYEKGEQYKYHHDYFDKSVNQKQRLHSFIVYLNDLDEVDGGATHFPLLKFRFTPYKTRAIHWKNIDLNGNPNELSLHAGEPLLTDKIKYVLTIWTRCEKY
jgi:prolyl 4-hydroxylase